MRTVAIDCRSNGWLSLQLVSTLQPPAGILTSLAGRSSPFWLCALRVRQPLQSADFLA